MASVSQFYTADHKGLSFELFPPKTEKGDAALMRHTEALMSFLLTTLHVPMAPAVPLNLKRWMS